MNEKKLSWNKVMLILAAVFVLGLTLVLTWRSLHFFFQRMALDYFYPWLKISIKAEDYAARKFLLAVPKDDLIKSLAAMQRENARLTAEAASAKMLRQENAALRDMMSLKKHAAEKSVCAEVLSRDPVSWDEVFTIDKGSSDGIQTGDPVVSVQLSADNKSLISVLAGRILRISRHTAVVATVYHREFSMGILLSESGQYGILKGAGGGMPPVISALPVSGKYGAGEIVLSGGFTGQIPSGIYIGVLQPRADGSVSRILNHLYAEADLHPAAAIRNLHFVVVLTHELEKDEDSEE